LPLNVPANSPLIYCNNTELMQAQVRINNGFTYECINDTVEITCPQFANDSDEMFCQKSSTDCNFIDIDENVSCKDGIVLNKFNIICNSTSLTNDNQTVLNCYEGLLHSTKASSIPTESATEKPMSIGAHIHVFLMKLMGKYDVVEPENPWVAEAITIPPEPTTTTENYWAKLQREMKVIEANRKWHEESMKWLNEHKQRFTTPAPTTTTHNYWVHKSMSPEVKEFMIKHKEKLDEARRKASGDISVQ
jgi:hypothetical protein